MSAACTPTSPAGSSLNAGIVGIVRDAGWAPRSASTDGRSERFDAVVLATHSDQALRLLEAPTADERRLLGAIRYQPQPRRPAPRHRA